MKEDPYESWTDEELREAAQGCTEFSCLYHGIFNQLLAERKKRGA